MPTFRNTKGCGQTATRTSRLTRCLDAFNSTAETRRPSITYQKSLNPGDERQLIAVQLTCHQFLLIPQGQNGIASMTPGEIWRMNWEPNTIRTFTHTCSSIFLFLKHFSFTTLILWMFRDRHPCNEFAMTARSHNTAQMLRRSHTKKVADHVRHPWRPKSPRPRMRLTHWFLHTDFTNLTPQDSILPQPEHIHSFTNYHKSKTILFH